MCNVKRTFARNKMTYSCQMDLCLFDIVMKTHVGSAMKTG